MTALPSPSFWRRLAALTYDTFLVLPLVMFSTAIAMGIYLLLTDAANASQAEQILPPFVVRLLALITIAGFYTAFWTRKGQTLGMQAWRIRVRSSTGGAVTFRQALLRCVCASLSLAPAAAGYWWCLFDKNGRYWHDYLSGTELELIPKP